MGRICSLHDLILSNILSHLPTDEAIRTKILSKQWRDLWFPTQQLVFRQKTRINTVFYLDEIHKFIDKALPLNTCPNITKYELVLCRELDYFSHSSFDLVLKAVILRNVQEITLDLQRGYNNPFSNNRYGLPEWLYSCASLERLTLRHSCLIESSWQREIYRSVSLKALTLEFTCLSDNDIETVLGCCPNLVNLELNRCYGFHQIYVADTSCLRKLVIVTSTKSGYGYYDVKPMEISAPTVKCLIIRDHIQRLKLIDVSSLVDVAVDFYALDSHPYFAVDNNNYYDHHHNNKLSTCFITCDERNWPRLEKDRGQCLAESLMEVLNKVSHAERLQLGTWCLKVVSSYIKKGPSLVMSLSKCKFLALETSMSRKDVPAVLHLLKCSPFVETLFVETTRSGNNKQVLKEKKVGLVKANSCLSNKKMKFSNSIMKHLKHVRIIGLSAGVVEFARFLLHNVVLLEKLELIKSNRDDDDDDDESLVIENILELPKSSPNTQILIS